MASPAEAERLDALHRLSILETDREDVFDDLAKLAAVICAKPIGAISLVDTDRLWFKAITGLAASEAPRVSSLCSYVTQVARGPLVVADAAEDPRFRDHAFVAGGPNIRFYAGAPIVTGNGHILGTVCVADTVPGSITDEQLWILTTLAGQAKRLIESRAAQHLLNEARSAIDAIVSIDAAGTVVSFNDGAAAMFGHHRDVVLGRSVTLLIPPGFVDAHLAGLERARTGGRTSLIGATVDVRALRHDGREFPVELSLSSWERDGKQFYTAVMRDVSAPRRSSAIQALMKRSAALANNSTTLGQAFPQVVEELAQFCGEGIVRAWLAEDRALAAQLLHTTGRLVLHPLRPGDLAVAPVPAVEAVDADGIAALETATGVQLLAPVRVDLATCALIALEGPPELIADTELRAAVAQIATDLAHVAQRERTVQLTLRALTDPLTGLANRRSVLETLRTRMDSRAGDVTGALLFLDLDRFKNVNDSLGHAVGDQVLKAVAARLTSLLRPGDQLARMGGDEFVVLCSPDVSGAESAAAVAGRLVDGLHEPFSVNSTAVYLGASIGIALLRAGISADTALRQADIAMYRAKDGGGNRAAVFDSDMDRRFRRRLDTDSALHQAIGTDQLLAHFQPIVDPGDRSVLGFEALIRWNRPGHGLVQPDEFIPLAQENGLIVAIGRQMLRSACQALIEWTATTESLRACYVSVNVAAAELHDDYHDRVLQILDETGLPPERLVLEITESALLTDIDRTRQILEKLRVAGVRVALDDFGTGYSSLSYLRQLPVDIIKIDRSFIGPLTTTPRAAALLDVVLNLAEALELSVVAEGVETAEQAAALDLRGCRSVQGYHFGRPVAPERMTAQLGLDERNRAVLI
ncbi:EAL domain-containing protein [Jatrophihabitans telluris]|uniref:EAL domain-containing protein n=1 Tax=Jatrophihabitans telluris TaxID=2038343 RepID=A0ABY4R042_9ACTN|nr:EAL domain-containing protein [Jatrophihabitans telluris]UQX88434.1 EAL domain-containing protein [Jatrophihabitans telluris]